MSSQYSKMPAADLEALARAEDKNALFEVGIRFKHEKNLYEARKYFTFAAQLGHAQSAAELGDFFEAEQNLERATALYKQALLKGYLPVSCKLASLLMDSDETDAVEILISSAVLGNEGSIKMLYEYYSELGNTKEANYWKSKLEKAEKQ